MLALVSLAFYGAGAVFVTVLIRLRRQRKVDRWLVPTMVIMMSALALEELLLLVGLAARIK